LAQGILTQGLTPGVELHSMYFSRSFLFAEA